MNFARLSAAALVAWVADMAFGYLVYGVLMRDLFAQHPEVFRPEAETNVALGFAASLLGFFVFAYVYAKGYEGGPGLQEGLRCGVLVGLLLVSFAVVWNYVTLRLSGTFGVYMAVATLLEMSLMGIIIGSIYRPAVSGSTRA